MNDRGQYGSRVGGRIGPGFALDHLQEQALRSVRIASGANPAPFWVVGIVPLQTAAWTKSVLAFATRDDAEARFARDTATGTPYMFVQVFARTETGLVPLSSWIDHDVVTPAPIVAVVGRDDRPQPEATPTWAVVIIATSVGMALHALWGVTSKKRDVLTWKAS